MHNEGNDIVFADEAKKKILKGVDILYRAVSTTLGPRGRNVGIDYGFSKTILHDGVSVAKYILLKDKTENFGAAIVMEAAKKQVDEVGDATTGTITLAHAIIMEAQKIVDAGVNPMQLRSELEKGVDTVINEINKYAVDVTTPIQKKQVATISAEDEVLGKLVADTIEKTGPNGLVTVEESKSYETFSEWEEGMQFDKGFASPYFVTDIATGKANLNDPRILVTDLQLTTEPLMPFFTEVFQKKGWPLVIIGPEITEALRNFLIINKMEGKISVLYVNAPMFGDKKNAFMQDIAILTGAQFISQEMGMDMKNITIDALGRAGRVTATQTATEIVGGKGDKKTISDRINLLQDQLENEESEIGRASCRERV